MRIWNDLLKAALLGTERSTLPEASLQQLRSKGLANTDSPEKQLLEGLAFQAMLEKVGFPILSLEDIPTAPIVEEEQFCSAAAMQHLEQILNGPYDKALREFIWYLRKADLYLAPESLPDFFYKCLSDKTLWQQIKPLIGSRGNWLLHLNPDWERLQSNANVEEWPTGDRETRLAILRYLREMQPDTAIVLLNSTWQKESHANKVAFMKTLEVQLNEGDAAFLEQALSDKRKEVRKQAVALLAKLSNSKWMARMKQRAEEWFQTDKNLSFQFPEQLDKQALSDGFELKPKTTSRFEKERLIIDQLLSVLPPSYWQERLHKEPLACLQYFYQAQDHSKNLLAALAKSVTYWCDPVWQEAFLKFWQQHQAEELWNNKVGKDLIASLPNAVFNTFILSHLKARPFLLQEEQLISQMICQGVQFWSDPLTIAIIKPFQDWMAKANNYDWSTIHYKKNSGSSGISG